MKTVLFSIILLAFILLATDCLSEEMAYEIGCKPEYAMEDSDTACFYSFGYKICNTNIAEKVCDAIAVECGHPIKCDKIAFILYKCFLVPVGAE